MSKNISQEYMKQNTARMNQGRDFCSKKPTIMVIKMARQPRKCSHVHTFRPYSMRSESSARFCVRSNHLSESLLSMSTTSNYSEAELRKLTVN